MKRLGLLMVLLLSGIMMKGQENVCEGFYPYKVGTKYEITNYDKKDKFTGKTQYELLEKKDSADGVDYQLKAVNIDDKEEEISTVEYSMFCNGEEIKMDMGMYIDDEQMKAYEGMEVSMTGGNMELPNTLSVGQELPDANLTMIVSNAGVKLITISVDVVDRKVEAQEDVTTSAGTFNCYKLTQTVKSKFGFMKMELETTEWYSKGVGMVKSETYKKGKFYGKSELTSFE